MSRLLLAPVAGTCLLAGLIPLAVAVVAAGHGVAAGLSDPVLAPALRLSALLAASAAIPGALLGLLAAASLRHAGAWARPVLGCAVLVLVLPASALAGMPAWPLPTLDHLAGPGSALVRGAALMLLVTARPVAALRPGLHRAALCAGATPFQAWRRIVLAPLWLPAVTGLALGFLAALAQTQAAAILAPHLDLADAWVLPGALLVVACSLVALGHMVAGIRNGRQGPMPAFAAMGDAAAAGGAGPRGLDGV